MSHAAEHRLNIPASIQFFQGCAGRKVAFSDYPSPTKTDTVLLIAVGRTETALKYQPLAEWFNQFNIHVVVCDHRGQGFSEHLAEDPQIGHVEHFDDYIHDLKTLYQQQQLDRFRHRLLLGHSMGGAISALYLAKYPDDFKAAAFTAPMFGIALPKYLPAAIAALIANLLSWRDHRLGRIHYAPTQQPMKWATFAENILSHDEHYYQQVQALYQQYPQLALGGVSNRWLATSLQACRQIMRLPPLATPTLLLTPLADAIVSTAAQQRFAACQPNNQNHCFPDSFHELLFETAPRRQAALEQLIKFYQRYIEN